MAIITTAVDQAVEEYGPPAPPTAVDLTPEAAQSYAAYDAARAAPATEPAPLYDQPPAPQSDLARMAATPGAAENFAAYDAAQPDINVQQMQQDAIGAPRNITNTAPTIQFQPPAEQPPEYEGLSTNPLAAGPSVYTQPGFENNRNFNPDETLGQGLANVAKQAPQVAAGFAAAPAQVLSGAIGEVPAPGLRAFLPPALGGEFDVKPIKEQDPVTQFVYQSLPYILAPQAGMAAFVASLPQSVQQEVEAYRNGQISGEKLALDLGMQLGPLIAPALAKLGIKGIGAAAEYAHSPEGKAFIDSAAGKVASERGEFNLPGKKPPGEPVPGDAAGAKGNTPGMPERSSVPTEPVNRATLDAATLKNYLAAEDQPAVLKMPIGEAQAVTSPAGESLHITRTGADAFDVQQLPKPLPGAGEAASSSLPSDKLPPPAEAPLTHEQLRPLYDEYRKLYGPAAEQKMVEAGLIPEGKPFAEIAPPVAPGATARSGADELGLGKPADALPADQQGALQTVHTSGGEMSADKGSLAQRIDAKPTTVDEAALAVTDWLRKGEKLRPDQEEMFRQQRAAQAGKMEAAYSASGDTAHLSAKAAGSGAFQRPEIAPLDLSPEMTSLIRHELNTTPVLQTFERTAAHDALDAMLNGHLPQPAQGAALGKVLGPTFVEQLGKRAGPNYESAVSQILNAPRSLMTMGDLSATLRQTIIYGANPMHWKRFGQAFVAQVKALRSQSVADELTRAITEHPDYAVLEGRVQLTGPKEGALGMHEEGYQAPFIAKIPGLGQVYNASERAFSAMTNKIRWDYAYDTVAKWRRQGVELTPQRLDNLGLYVNNLTGRGTLPKVLADHSATLNAVFFAPRFVASRAQLIGDLLRPSQSVEVRMMAAQDLGAFVATGVGTLAALKYIGGVNVGIDPRSSDFGKYTFMGQHHDFWAGFSPIARLIAQEGTGQRVTSSGNVTDRDRVGAFTQFMRTKLAPVPGLGADVLTGRDLGGNAVDTDSFKHLDTQNPLYKLTASLVLQDAIDAYKQGGVKGAALAAPGVILGEGVTSYGQPGRDLIAARNAAARRDINPDTGKPYADFAEASAKLGGPAAMAKYASDPAVAAAATASGQSQIDSGSIGGQIKSARAQANTSQQQIDDAFKQNGNLTKWKDAKANNAANLAGQIQKITGGKSYTSGDKVLDGYYAIFSDPRYVGPNGAVTDSSKLNNALDAYAAGLSPADQKHLSDNTGLSETTPMVQNYRDASKLVRDAGYWKIRDQVAQQVSRGQAQTYQQALSDTSPRGVGLLKAINSAMVQKQRVFRAQNPQVDAALAQWYSGKPVTRAASDALFAATGKRVWPK